MKPDKQLEGLLAAIEGGEGSSVYLVTGDLVVAEAQAGRLAESLSRRFGGPVQTFRRPADLAGLFSDLLTYSLFGDGKVLVVVDTALLADRSAAAELIDESAAALATGQLPAGPLEPLSASHREAASRLIQTLHLFALDPRGRDAGVVIDELPKWVLQGGAAVRRKSPRGRVAKDIETLRDGLAGLLRAGLDHGLLGFAETDLAQLGELIERGLPDRHALVLVEASVAAEHPVVARLKEHGAFLELARITAEKAGEWQGLSSLIGEVQHETGVGIEQPALAELARRTLRQKGDWQQRSTDPESTARLAGEYRKLASLIQGRGLERIDLATVVDNVQDRGEEDVWQILDALGQGKGEEAVRRYRRLIEGADDPMASRLSFFSLLAGFCRQLAAVAGMARVGKVPPNIRNYNLFKERWAPPLQADPPRGGKNPLAGLHPFRLHRAYLLASQLSRAELVRLPWRVLETELMIKGESTQADAAVTSLLARLATRAVVNA